MKYHFKVILNKLVALEKKVFVIDKLYKKLFKDIKKDELFLLDCIEENI